MRAPPALSLHADANNQWDLSAALVDDPRQTPFFKAMALAKGTVSVLDTHGVVFTRVWCAAPPQPRGVRMCRRLCACAVCQAV